LPKILVVSRHFPPLGSTGGSIRLVKFLKYTSLKGWWYVVLTQDLEKTVVPEEKLSTSLLDDIPPETQIERVPAPFRGESVQSKSYLVNKIWIIFRNIANKILGNSSLGWGLNVFFRGALNSKKWGIDLIYSVSPPFTDAFIGALLAVISQKPYVLDLKDDWVGSPDFLKKPIIRQKIENVLEKLIVVSTSAVVTVTPESNQLYSERYEYPGKPSKVFCIPNGCDLEEYKELFGRERHIDTEKFTILSAAWGFRKDYRDLSSFLSSLDLFLKRHPEARKKVEVTLLGNSLSAEYKNRIAELGLQEVIKELRVVDRRELVKYLWAADLFLLIQPANNTTAISGTLYEYWATGKAPVLLISEKSASSSLVERYHLGKHFHFSQIEQCANYIESVYQKYQNGNPEWISREGIEEFDRQNLAAQMANVWQKILPKDMS
jgi:hypothetical protein